MYVHTLWPSVKPLSRCGNFSIFQDSAILDFQKFEILTTLTVKENVRHRTKLVPIASVQSLRIYGDFLIFF